MPSSHLILCRPLLLLPSIFPSIRVFLNESALRIRWPKYWSFSFNISPSNEHSGLISFTIQAPQLEKTHDTPPSSRDEGLVSCLAQCWWTVVFPLNPSIREALLSSRSPEEGLATQGATHTHYQLHGLLCSIFTASGHLRKRVPAQYLGKMSPGQGTTTERPAESWHQSPDAGSPCKLAIVRSEERRVG